VFSEGVSAAAWPNVPHRLAALGLVVALSALLVTMWPSLHFAWVEQPAYSHGYLLLGIAIWLGYRELRRAPLGALEPSAIGLAALALVVAGATFGRAADVALATQLGFPLTLIMGLWAVAGRRTALRFLVPIGYLVFAIPVWDVINDALRDLTVVVVGELTRQSAIPAFIEGNFIHIPSGVFEVEGGCSGLHYLIVGCALSVLYGLLTFDRWLPRLYVVALGIVLALVANWIRVFVVIVAGHLTDMQHYLVTVDHYYFGWALFFVVLGPLFFFGRHLERVAPRYAPPPSRHGAEHAMRKPEAERASDLPARNTRRSGAANAMMVAAAGVLAVGAWLSFRVAARPAAPAAEWKLVLPAVEGWRYEGEWDSIMWPRFVNADVEGGARYGRGTEHVSVYIAHYAVQGQGKEVVYYENFPAGSSGIAGRAMVSEVLGGVTAIPLAELEVAEADGERRLVWYGYQVAGRRTGDPLVAKFYQALGSMQGRWDAQTIVAAAPCSADCASARETLARFAAAGFEPLLAFVQNDTRSIDSE
jgi:exosortase A